MRGRKPGLAAAYLVLVVMAASQVALSGTRRHDVSGQLYINLGADPNFTCVGKVETSGILGSGTLIAPNYVLTAAHIGEASGTMTFTAGGSSSQRAWKVTHPNWTGDLSGGWDISLVRLNSLVLGITPASLYTGNEIGQIGTTVGYGASGTGLTGAVEPSGFIKRAGQNVLDADGTALGYANRVMLADFDDPSGGGVDNWLGEATSLPLEFLAAPGDSGGGTFIDTGNGLKLAGVTSFVTNRDGTMDCDYGDAMGLIRVSMFTSWINGVLGTTYEMRWAGTSAGYNTPDRWQTTFGGQAVNAVPGAMDRILLDSASQYTITLPAANLSNDRLTMAAGTVTLDLSGRTYSLTASSTGTPSLSVGSAAGQQQLAITNGTLSTASAWIGADAGARGTVNVSGAATQWRSTGSVYVGGSDTAGGGVGLLAIASQGSVNVGGTLRVWPAGRAAITGGSLTVGYLDARGTLSMQLRSPPSWDRLTATHSASLAGRLALDVVSRPREGDVFAVIMATGFSGGFSTIASNVTTGLIDGIPAFTGGAAGTSYEVVFHGLTMGDSNASHSVDGGDLSLMGGGWVQGGRTWATGDFNGDGSADGGDLSLMGTNWMWGSLSPAPVQPLPEPASAMLLLACGTGLLRRRTRH